MLTHAHIAGSAARAPDTAPSGMTNTPTKAELLDRAKIAVEANDESLHDAAEALAETQELHGTSQAEMARAVGKSEAWVSKLLQWHRSGYEAESPFGPRTKAGRLEHAKDRADSRASKPPKASKAGTQPDVDDDAAASGERRKAENAKLDAESEAATSTAKSPLAEIKAAVDRWFPKMDEDAIREVVAYVNASAQAQAADEDCLP